MEAEIEYAWNGETSLAYQVLEGPEPGLLYLQGYLSNVELNADHPPFARFLRELARINRVVVADRRGLGCSERFTPADTPALEDLLADVSAVLDAAGCNRCTLFATGECGPLACLFAATFPDRISALVLWATAATWKVSEETPWGHSSEEHEAAARVIRDHLGDGSWTRARAPSTITGEAGMAWARRYERLSLTPGSVYWEGVRFAETDVRGVLSSVHVPALVLHRKDDPEEPIESGRFLASRLPRATLEELEGGDHFPWAGDQRPVLLAVERFLAGVRSDLEELNRVLSTVLFTDIVDSTQKAAELGNARWRELLERHHSTVRGLLALYRGEEVNTTGDGFLATFDGPLRGILCAQAIVEAMHTLGIEVRAGLHTGDVERVGDQLAGVAVHAGARVAHLARPSEVLVSQTVKDLVVGSGLAFEDRGVHELKGVPGLWGVYALVPGVRAPARGAAQ
ncbi:MAG TPA: adenylate/guanylate cyclase domain-containing protein [Gaiellaceae bacterium]|nr:adenylate/guanylate cyclase domain-containing protein [Gaiellaceae bacterium]